MPLSMPKEPDSAFNSSVSKSKNFILTVHDMPAVRYLTRLSAATWVSNNNNNYNYDNVYGAVIMT